MKSLSTLFILVALLAACAPGTPAASTEAEAAITAAPVTAAVTAAPTPTRPIQPKPGMMLAGPIEMGDQAKNALISLNTSADGKAIASWSVVFEELKCGEFTTGMLIMREQDPTPIQGVAFQDPKSSIGELEGKFTADETVSGTIHLLINIGFGDPIECGTWEWQTIATGPAPTKALETPAAPAGTPGTRPTMISPGTPVPVVEATKPGGETPILNETIQESGDNLFIYGEVENRTQSNLAQMQVFAKIYDANGKLVGEGDGPVTPNILPPGERAPFEVIVPKPSSYQSYELALEATPTDRQPFNGLRMAQEVIKTDPMGWLHLYGMVENISDSNVEYADVIGAFYDDQGKVIGFGRAAPASPGYILKPGEVGPIDLSPSPMVTEEFASYRLLLDGSATDQLQPPALEVLKTEATDDGLRGEVKFTGAGKASYPMVVAVFYDQAGEIVSIDFGIVEPDVLPAGETGQFEMFLLTKDYANYELFTEYSND